MDFKPYVDLLSALLTPTIGITTAWIAVQQYRLAKERMRRELYDRQFGVYKGAVEVLSSIMTFGKVRDDDFATWARVTAEKGFLFDQELCDYLESIRRRIVELWAFDRQLSESANLPSDKRAALAGERGEAMKWLVGQLPGLQERFARYLRIA